MKVEVKFIFDIDTDEPISSSFLDEAISNMDKVKVEFYMDSYTIVHR